MRVSELKCLARHDESHFDLGREAERMPGTLRRYADDRPRAVIIALATKLGIFQSPRLRERPAVGLMLGSSKAQFMLHVPLGDSRSRESHSS